MCYDRLTDDTAFKVTRLPPLNHTGALVKKNMIKMFNPIKGEKHLLCQNMIHQSLEAHLS